MTELNQGFGNDEFHTSAVGDGVGDLPDSGLQTGRIDDGFGDTLQYDPKPDIAPVTTPDGTLGIILRATNDEALRNRY